MKKLIFTLHALISILLVPIILVLGFGAIVLEVAAKLIMMTTLWEGEQ